MKLELYNIESSLEFINQLVNENEKCVIISDPPYNVKYHYKDYHDNKPLAQYVQETSEILIRDDIPCVVLAYPEIVYQFSIYRQKTPTKICTWVYNANTAHQHRNIAYYNIKPNFNLVRQPYKNPNDARIKKLIAEGSKGAKLYDWWEFQQVKNVSAEKTAHPCQIPEKVMRNVCGIIPDTGWTVIDPFCGAGSTAIGCLKANEDREEEVFVKFIGIDITQEYLDITTDRVQKYN